MAVALIIFFLLLQLPPVDDALNWTHSWISFVLVMVCGVFVGDEAGRRQRQSRRRMWHEAWSGYEAELEAARAKIIRADDEVVAPVLGAMKVHGWARRAVSPWHDLKVALPDIPAMSAHAFQSRLDAQAEEAAEAGERQRVEAILKGTDESKDDVALATVRARAVHLHEREQQHQENVRIALDQLQRAQEQAQHLLSSAEARKYVNNGPDGLDLGVPHRWTEDVPQ